MRLRVEFTELRQPFALTFKELSAPLGVNFGEVYKVEVNANFPVYDGSYSVTPSVVSQVLPTERKVLSKDIEILEIPYAEVTNTSNGKTVTIA